MKHRTLVFTTAFLLATFVGGGAAHARVSGLMAWWKFDSDGTDSSAFANTATLNGPSANGSTVRNGSMYFNSAESDWASVADDDTKSFSAVRLLASGGSMSISFWLYPGDFNEIGGARATFIENKNSATYYYKIGVASAGTPATSKVQVKMRNGTTYEKRTTTALSKNTWYHIVMTFNGSDGTIKFYINGTESSTEAASAYTMGANYAFLSLGRTYYGSGTGYMHGLLDEVRIYSRVLSLAEVKDLYYFRRDDANLFGGE